MTYSKKVSDHVFERVSLALDRLAADPTLRRTKRELERLSGLSHDAVARAFRQDAAERDSKWQITRRYQQLLDAEHGKRSPHEVAVREAEQRLREKQQHINELEVQLDRYAMALYAYWLDAGTNAEGPAAESESVVPIGRNRARASKRSRT